MYHISIKTVGCIVAFSSALALYPAQEIADSAERFEAFQNMIRTSNHLSLPIMSPDARATQEISLQEANRITQAVRTVVLEALAPWMQTIRISRSSTDATRVPYQVINLKALTQMTPEELNAIGKSLNARLDAVSPTNEQILSLVQHHADLLQDTLGSIAAQCVTFDRGTRAQLSRLLMQWLRVIEQETPALLAFFSDKETIERLIKTPRQLLERVKVIHAKSRQHQHIAAPYLALWHVIVQGVLGGKSYTILFDQLPNADALKATYKKLVQLFGTSPAATELLRLLPDAREMLTGDFLVWSLIGLLFLPDTFQNQLTQAHKSPAR